MKYLLLLSVSFLVAGCGSLFGGPVKEFEGSFIFLNSPNELRVNCSDVAKRGDFGGTEDGAICTVQISEDTVIRTEEGEILTAENLEKNEVVQTDSLVRVILNEERDIGESVEGRRGLKADEVIFLE